jgi:curli biogenesis system outer membrane secretion channel CsgG
MKSWFVAPFLVFVTLAAPAARAAGPTRAGILPFDVVNIDRATPETGAALAKLVRIAMIEGHKLTPVLLTLPAGTEQPVTPDAASSIGKSATTAVVLVGTVIDASVSSSSHGLSTGLIPSLGVGGQVSRTTAHVSLHVDLVDPAKGTIVDSFDVEGKATDTGVGMDLSTALGGMNSNSNSWMNTPMGKALSQAAKKINDEVAKRAKKFSGS